MSRAVTVWTIPLDHYSRDDAADWAVLGSDERERAGRFHFREHRDRFVARRAAYRRLLGSVVGLKPEALTFVAGTHGKPALADKGPAFSATHRDDWAMLAVADRPLGIDLEAGRPALADPAFVEAVLTPTEYALWQALPVPARAAAGQAAWTRKEALVKAMGTGLSRDVATLDVWRPQDPPDRWTDPIDGARWSLAALPAPPGFAAALAIADDGAAPEIRLEACVEGRR